MNNSIRKLNLDRVAIYQIKVPRHFEESWADWDGKIKISVENEGDTQPITTMTSALDQVALMDYSESFMP